MAKPVQLALSVRLDDAATYKNFCPLETLNHAAVLNFLQAGEQREIFGYLWGGADSGVSHLLQAACHQALATGLAAQYLPLAEFLDYPADDVLEGLDQLNLICLDNIDAIAGNQAWELAVFRLFNQAREQSVQLLLGADAPPRELGVQLADLVSRFGWGPVFHLPAPGDQEKYRILQFRAARLGLELKEDVVRYLLSRFERSLSSLLERLTELDKASLQRQRKITIPFIRELFDR